MSRCTLATRQGLFEAPCAPPEKRATGSHSPGGYTNQGSAFRRDWPPYLQGVCEIGSSLPSYQAVSL